jgi:hypothetical protein
VLVDGWLGDAKGELTGIFVVVQQVEEDNALHKDISENRADGNSNVVLLVSVMTNVGLEGQYLEDHVKDTNNNGRT